MKLLLINPTIIGKFEHLHIGLTTIGTYIRRHSSHQVRILDFFCHRKQWQHHLRTILDDYRPDLIGIYISTPYFPSAQKIAKVIKEHRADIPIVAGGHHSTLSPNEVMEKKDFDLLIVGEGEKPMLALLNVLADGKPLEEVPGLWWRKDGVIYSTPKTTLLPAGEMPPADWSLHDEEALNNLFYLWGILPVMGSRGCPANCSFCSITNIQKMYEGECFLRFRDPISVVDEIHGHYEKYKDKGMRIVFFYDLNFLLDPQWLERFVTEYKRRGLNRKLKWSAYTRADHVTKEVVALLKDSGCINLRIGIEAANPRMRNEIYRKDVSQEQLYFALKEISRMDISITGYFIAGGPGERPEWLLESLDLAWRYGIENPVFFLYKPLAGTDILDMAESLGSFVLADTMKEAWDYLHGVNMKHLNIEGWQLEAFVALSQLVFGVPIITHQLLREGPMYFVRLAQYVKSALRLGFSPYMATCYYVFYGFDHMKNPVIFPAHPTPSFFWRLMIGCTKLWLKTPSSNKERAAYAPQR